MLNNKRPNMVRFRNGPIYLVRTQAGFNKAVNEQLDLQGLNYVHGYPLNYPSIVVFSEGYRGYRYLQAMPIKLNVLYEFLVDNDLEGLLTFIRESNGKTS